jgi:hypothetical protein
MNHLDPDLAYRIERDAAVSCGDHDPDHENCRHAWNAAHPDDPVTEEEQHAFEERVIQSIRSNPEGQLRAEYRAAMNRIEAALALHVPRDFPVPNGVVLQICATCHSDYPCPTVDALLRKKS